MIEPDLGNNVNPASKLECVPKWTRKIIKNLQLVIWKPMVHSGPKFFTNPQKCHLNSPCPVASRQFQVDAFFGSRGCETLGVKVDIRRFGPILIPKYVLSISIYQYVLSIFLPKNKFSNKKQMIKWSNDCFLLGNLFFVTCFFSGESELDFSSRLVSRHPRHAGWIVATHFDS